MKTSTLVLFLVCINLFLIVGDASFNLTTSPINNVFNGIFFIPEDLENTNVTPYIYDISTNNDGTYNITYLTGNIPRNKVAASSGTGSTDNIGFLDALSIGWNMILFIFDLTFKAFTFWFQLPGMPIYWAVLIAIPFGLAYLWAVISLFTGRDT